MEAKEKLVINETICPKCGSPAKMYDWMPIATVPGAMHTAVCCTNKHCCHVLGSAITELIEPVKSMPINDLKSFFERLPELFGFGNMNCF